MSLINRVLIDTHINNLPIVKKLHRDTTTGKVIITIALAALAGFSTHFLILTEIIGVPSLYVSSFVFVSFPTVFIRNNPGPLAEILVLGGTVSLVALTIFLKISPTMLVIAAAGSVITTFMHQNTSPSAEMKATRALVEVVKANTDLDIEEIKNQLKEGAYVNHVFNKGDVGVKIWRERITNEFVSYPKWAMKTTALMDATIVGNKEVVALLLENEADVNLKDIHGNTALMHAVIYGQTEIVQLLLENGAEVNLRNKEGNTALMHAVMNNNTDIVNLLLDMVDVNLLLDMLDVNLKNKLGDTALIEAAKKGRHEIVELLLNKDADVNLKTNDSWTALMWAAHFGHKETVILLLENNAHIGHSWDKAKEGGFDELHQIIMEEIRTNPQPHPIDRYIKKFDECIKKVGGYFNFAQA